MSATEHTAHGRPPEPEDELAQLVRDLADRIETLQADVRRLGGPGLPTGEPGWASEDDDRPAAPSYDWIVSLGAPIRRRPEIPRLLLEVLFLAATALAAALAKLDGLAIAGVMAAAWILVAAIEWASARAERSRGEIPYFAPPAAAEPPPADPSWFVPPVEHTLVEQPPDSPTTIKKLPPVQPDIDATVERPPPSS